MGLSLLCLVLILVPLVSHPTLVHSLHIPLLCSPFHCWVHDQSWSRLFLVSNGLDIGLELQCTKSMGFSFFCLVLISAPLVSNPTLLNSLHNPLLCSPFQCWFNDQSSSWLFLVLVLSLVLSYNCTKSKGFHSCAWSWSRHLWSRTQHCSIICMYTPLLCSPFQCWDLDLDFSLSWSWSWSWAIMCTVYGAFISMPGLDFGTSGLEPNTAPFFAYSSFMLSLSVLVQDQSWSWLFLVLVLVLSYVQSLWDFHFCAWSWSQHLWSRTQHCSILCILIFYVLLSSVGFKTSLDLDFSLSWSWAWSWAIMYKVYGALILYDLVLILAPLVSNPTLLNYLACTVSTLPKSNLLVLKK